MISHETWNICHMWNICRYMTCVTHICHTSEAYACSTLFNKFKVSLRIPADLNCADRSVYLRHHFCAEVHTLLAVAVGYPCGKLPWGRYTNTWGHMLNERNIDDMSQWWNVTDVDLTENFPKKPSMIIGMTCLANAHCSFHGWVFTRLSGAKLSSCVVHLSEFPDQILHTNRKTLKI